MESAHTTALVHARTVDLFLTMKTSSLSVVCLYSPMEPNGVAHINRPFAVYDHMVQKPPCGISKTKEYSLSCFVLDIPLGGLLSSMAVFVPCDRKLQRAYFVPLINTKHFVTQHLVTQRNASQRSVTPQKRAANRPTVNAILYRTPQKK